MITDNKNNNSRPTWDEYFIDLLHSISKRATCDRGKSACVIVRDNQILTTGYVGSPPGFPHCDDVGHKFKKILHDNGGISEHCVRTIHAEQNAILQAAKNGISLKSATCYCTMTPCRNCAMFLISIGIKRVVAEYKYHQGQESEDMFKHAGIDIEFIYDEVMQYNKK